MDVVDRHVTQIKKALDEWALPRKLMIGIEGYSGSGKTTILKELAERRSDIIPVYLDDFLASRAEREALANEPLTYKTDWHRAKWYRYEALQKLIKRFLNSDELYRTVLYDTATADWTRKATFDLSKRMMVIEGVMLLRSPAAEKLDRLILLESDRDAADRRRLERLMRKTRGAVGGDAQVWADKFHRLYSAYLAHERPDEQADLMIRVDAHRA